MHIGEHAHAAAEESARYQRSFETTTVQTHWQVPLGGNVNTLNFGRGFPQLGSIAGPTVKESVYAGSITCLPSGLGCVIFVASQALSPNRLEL